MTTYAITRPRSHGARVVSHPRLIVRDVPEDATSREVLAWLDDYDPQFDAAVPEDEWAATVQREADGCPVVKWRGRPGRPEVGPAIQIRLHPELLAQVDQVASEDRATRAETIRSLLGEALARRSYEAAREWRL